LKEILKLPYYFKAKLWNEGILNQHLVSYIGSENKDGEEPEPFYVDASG